MLLQKFLLLGATAFSMNSIAQKGSPPPEVVNINHTTNYPQHVDFSPDMVKQLKVPAGWKVSVAASGLGKPRMLALGNQGELYITRRDAGDVLLLKDVDGDHKFDELQTIVSDFKGVHGIALHNGWLYLCNNRDLKRFRLNADGTVGAEEWLLNDLPDGGQHGNRTMDFGPDGKLYLSVGSTCNDCAETNKESATMLQIDTSTWKRIIWARGLRNTIGFDWSPATQTMFGVDNGGDAKGDDWPPEELNELKQDKDYGWPLAYGKQEPDDTRENPPGMTKEAFAKTTEPSILEFPAHSAPIAFRFFGQATMVPDSLKDDALVCWHGSWNKKNPDGFKVQRIVFEKGKAVRAVDFLSGFYDRARRTRFGRPAGLMVAADGAVYIADDANGIVYCVEQKK